jgi:hypothetical protein
LSNPRTVAYVADGEKDHGFNKLSPYPFWDGAHLATRFAASGA